MSEDAKAVHSARDTDGYFANANLGAWKLKYSLDNDTNKFAWASNGEEKWTTTFPEIGTIELTPVSTNDTTYEGCPYKFTGYAQGMFFTLYVAHLELQEGEDFIPNVMFIDVIGEPMVNQMPITEIVHENQTAGKGVVWEMEDEFNNLCSYDFKNIQFKRSLITSTLESPSEEECAFYGKYVGQDKLPSLREGYAIDPNDSKYLYTFSVITSDGTVKDNSMGMDLTSDGVGIIHFCKSNRMRNNVNNLSFKFDLNNNVFVAIFNSSNEMENLMVIGNTFGTLCFGNTFVNTTNFNTFGNSCNGNTFGNGCNSNTFENECNDNTFGNKCNSNIFGNECYSNIFGNKCYRNTFENSFYYNTFGNDCSNNTFGNDCSNNTFGNNCGSNKFGNSCGRNKFGDMCNCNTFGNNCNDNTFGNECDRNIFGNECYYNIFGNGFDDNIFGNSCGSNTFGNECYRNTFGNGCWETTFKNDYIRYCTFFDGIQYLNVSVTTASDNYLQNMLVLNGTNGLGTTSTINNSLITAGRDYTTTVSKNSSGTLTSKVLMD